MKILTDSLFDRTLNGLEKSLDLTWKRNESIVSNIANAETPGYRATTLDFAGELDRAFGKQDESVARTNARHLDIGGEGVSHLIADVSGPTKGDGNNVDVDLQMGQLEYNRGQYARAADLMRRKMRFISSAIRLSQ